MPKETGERNKGAGVFRRGLSVVFRYARSEPRTFAISVVGASLYGATAVLATVVLGRVTQQVILPAFDHGVDGSTVVGAAVALLAIGVLRAVSIVMRRYYAGMTRFRVQARWRRRITDVYLDAPLTYHQSQPTGQLLAHTDNDVLAATEVLSPFPFTVGVLALVVFALISLALVDIWMMVLALAFFPVLGVMNHLYTKRIEGPAERVQERVGHVSRIVHESIDGALVVKTLGRSRLEVDRLASAADDLRVTRIEVGRLRGSFDPVLQGLPTIGAIALLALGSWEISLGRINTGELVQAIALFSILAFPIEVVGFFLEELPRAVVAAARLERVVSQPPAVVPAPGEGLTLPARPLELELEHVSFGYLPGEAVLDDVSLRVEPGEVVALVGATGAGKTTMCELIAHLVDPTRGVVRVGGVDLRRVDPSSLADAVALVFQETFLFADTLWENVTLGADVANDEVRRALSVARADRFVADLPMGVATVVGERGVTLSGGQRQRIALARALLRQPRALVLDDATSAVDPVVESEILDGLRRELSTTTLIVAQRVSTIELADRVAFLDGGRIVGEGSRAHLKATIPAYARIVQAYEVGRGAAGVAGSR
jgi:ABC-type multidrug transport system fused ATPase/permease subunit